ncbi:MAG: PEP/pyruvate-binding domain-containing protein, partial [Desulfobacterales bacterium]
MQGALDRPLETVHPNIRIFHDLMPHRIRDILLISTPYDAWIMERDSPVSEQIIHAYRGLNLGHPPRLTWVSSFDAALAEIARKTYGLVIVITRLGSLDPVSLGRRIKAAAPDLPVVLLNHQVLPSLESEPKPMEEIDGSFAWSGNPDIMVALIKAAEDRLNVVPDTELAGIRVILFVEDSPVYRSSLLPILYKEIFLQTRKVVAESLNEEHGLMRTRARPKILVADTYERAVDLYQSFKPFVLGIISDVQFPRGGQPDDAAGISLLSWIKEDRWDIPLLLTSADPSNARKARTIPAAFIHKNSPTLHNEVRQFLLSRFGFGDFVFQTPDGEEIARASNLRGFEKALAEIPERVFAYHWSRNDFSRWLFARTEILVASRMRPVTSDDFSGDIDRMRRHLVENLEERRRWSLRGEIVEFAADGFDPDFEIAKIGRGSLGGKARGIAFMADLLKRHENQLALSPKVRLFLPQTLVLSTTVFESFIEENALTDAPDWHLSDEDILGRFLEATFPEDVERDLAAMLLQWRGPLAVRPSSLLEDAQFHASAALYSTFLLPNSAPDSARRLAELVDAIKRIYASTYFEAPMRFAGRVGHRLEEERMAIVVQQAVGQKRGNLFYPLFSGVAQSINYYPFGEMKSAEGIVTMVAGLGHAMKSGENAFRFSPRRPFIQPERSRIDDILDNQQRRLFALSLEPAATEGGKGSFGTVSIPVDGIVDAPHFHLITSTYFPEEHRLRDSASGSGPQVITFANLTKTDTYAFNRLLWELLSLGSGGLGCPVEIEFAADARPEAVGSIDLALLRIRPMASREEHAVVVIEDADSAGAVCTSVQALGNGILEDVEDIVVVMPDRFDPGKT